MRSRSLGLLGAGVLGLTALLSEGSLPKTLPSVLFASRSIPAVTNALPPLSLETAYATGFLDENENGICDKTEYSTTNHTPHLYRNMTLRVHLPLSCAGKQMRVFVRQGKEPLYVSVSTMPARAEFPPDAIGICVLTLPLDTYATWREEHAVLSGRLPERIDVNIAEYENGGILMTPRWSFPLWLHLHETFTPPTQ